MAEPIRNFETRALTFRDVTRPVLVAASPGPAVLILHEAFGMTATLASFAETIRAAGFRPYMPVLFGSTEPVHGGAAKAGRFVRFLCVGRQFCVFTQSESGPWSEWLRDLADHAADDARFAGVGVIGLCLTGNFALSTAVNPRVKAPVMGEPSLPFRGPGLHLTAAELAAIRARTDLEVRAYRYSTDPLCPAARFERLQAALGPAFKGQTLPAGEKLHSVFTDDLRDADGRPRHDKVEEVIGFLRDRLG